MRTSSASSPKKKNEPQWLLDWRLKAFAIWQKMEEPLWAAVKYPPIDYQDAYYYAAPVNKAEAEVAWTRSILNC